MKKSGLIVGAFAVAGIGTAAAIYAFRGRGSPASPPAQPFTSPPAAPSLRPIGRVAPGALSPVNLTQMRRGVPAIGVRAPSTGTRLQLPPGVSIARPPMGTGPQLPPGVSVAPRTDQGSRTGPQFPPGGSVAPRGDQAAPAPSSDGLAFLRPTDPNNPLRVVAENVPVYGQAIAVANTVTNAIEQATGIDISGGKYVSAGVKKAKKFFKDLF